MSSERLLIFCGCWLDATGLRLGCAVSTAVACALGCAWWFREVVADQVRGGVVNMLLGPEGTRLVGCVFSGRHRGYQTVLCLSVFSLLFLHCCVGGEAVGCEWWGVGGVWFVVGGSLRCA